VSGETFDRAHALDLFRTMLLVRRFEETCAEMYAAQKIRGFLHLAIGEEATAVGAIRALAGDDAIVATYREHGHALARGMSPASVMAEMFGRATGCARGRGGSMHLADVSRRFYGGFAIVGGGVPLAVGLALADRMRAQRRTTAVFFGDGAMEEGELHESLNLAALWKLPVLFLCENNLYAMGTAIGRHSSNPDLSAKPPTYGIPAERVDGMDVVAVERAVRAAADAVREGGGPRFVELLTYRFRAHSMYDADRYRTKDEIAEWKRRDPIELFAARLIEAGVLDASARESIDREVTAAIASAVSEADAAPLEPVESLTRDLHAHEVTR
jgi:pyruvate dehydrogenase E1 component alpha subunit